MRQKRPCGQELPTGATAPGKLETLGTKSQASEGEKQMAHDRKVVVSPVTSTGGYRLEGTVNGAQTSFLVDTGVTKKSAPPIFGTPVSIILGFVAPPIQFS